MGDFKSEPESRLPIPRPALAPQRRRLQPPSSSAFGAARLAVLGLLLALAPANRAHADDAALKQRVEALEKTVASQTTQISALLKSLNTEVTRAQIAEALLAAGLLAESNARKQSDATTLTAAKAYADTRPGPPGPQGEAGPQGPAGNAGPAGLFTDDQVTTLQSLTGLTSVVNGTEIFFTGANLHVVNGLGATNGFPSDPLDSDASQTNGLGNLIIGYNATRPVADENIRTGSHNLVLGDWNNYYGYGGLVGGVSNDIFGSYSSAAGGKSNTAGGFASFISGGLSLTASDLERP